MFSRNRTSQIHNPVFTAKHKIINLSVTLCILFISIGITGCDEIQDAVDDEEEGQEEVEIITEEVTPDEAAEAREFWTRDRMLEASPSQTNFTPHDGEDPPQLSEAEDPLPGVNVETADGSVPEPLKDIDFENFEDSNLLARADTAIQHASEVSSNYTQYPFRAVGKVFYSDDGNWNACSAAVIASENRSIVWTAGHCVAEQGAENWYDNWIFVPAYKDGNAPLGQWGARTKTTFVGWYSNGNRNYDLAAVVVEEKDNRSIASVTGSLGWIFNGSRNQDWRELGYPGSGSLFSGQRMWQCFAPYSGADGVGSNPGPRTSAIRDCDMTGGASGGPWVVSFENCPACYINSATSWGWWRRGHGSLSTQLAGPYHGSAARQLLQFAEGL